MTIKKSLLSLSALMVLTVNMSAFSLPSFLQGFLSNNRTTATPAATTTTTPTSSSPSFLSKVENMYKSETQGSTSKKAMVDAGLGAVAGAAVGGLSHRGLLHGALMGGAAGGGIGLLTSSKYFQQHSKEKDVAAVGVGALGMYLAGKSGHGLL